LDNLVNELGQDAAIAVECDVTDADARAHLVDTTVERLGPVDVLVNNAGVGSPLPALDEPVEQFRATVDVNLLSVFALSQLVGRGMVERGAGAIVNVASMFGLVASGIVPQASYVASKHAVVGLTKELAAEWARRGVRVNAVAPGWFPSEMTEEMFDDERSMSWVRRNTPMGRGGQEHELDGAVLFLASDASSFVTGHVLYVDGGWTIV
jgi:NAD(P)-dependent dehydrogenase (short-subunit alcohol dehydrogenase family)